MKRHKKRRRKSRAKYDYSNTLDKVKVEKLIEDDLKFVMEIYKDLSKYLWYKGWDRGLRGQTLDDCISEGIIEVIRLLSIGKLPRIREFAFVKARNKVLMLISLGGLRRTLGDAGGPYIVNRGAKSGKEIKQVKIYRNREMLFSEMVPIRYKDNPRYELIEETTWRHIA